MADIFRSSKLRLERAKKHTIELESRIKSFFCTAPYPFVIEPDDDDLLKYRFIKPIPEDLEAIATDAIDNLRSVLDHVWHAIAVKSMAIKPLGKAYFPFADSASDLERMINTGCKNFPRDIISLLRGFKPYKGGNDLLWGLNRVCAADKHRHNMLASVVQWIEGMYSPLNSGEVIAATNPRWDSREYKIIYNLIEANTKIEYDIKLTFSIPFYEVDGVFGQPAVAVLNKLVSIVESILMAFEAETKRLGYI